MTSFTGVLGQLQLEIMKKIAESKKLLVVNQLAQSLDRDHSTIFRSVEVLIDKALVSPIQDVPRGRKFLVLTDMGAFVAIGFAKVNLNTLMENHPEQSMPDIVTRLMEFIEPETLSFVSEGLFQALSSENIFDDDGNQILDSTDFRALSAYSMVDIMDTILYNVGPEAITDKEGCLKYLADASKRFSAHTNELTKMIG